MMSDTNARKIKSWMVLNGIRQVEIAQEMGLSGTMIYRFINGQTVSKRVFEYFISRGCPREYFAGRPEAKRAA